MQISLPHGLTSIRGICFRSKHLPFLPNNLHFWNGFGTVPERRHLNGAPATFANGPFSLDPFQSALPSLRITKRRLKRVEAIQLVREQRDNRSQEVSYNARPFVLCGLPLRRPPGDQLVYTRRNGSFVLEITAHPRFGLPTVRADCTCAPLAFGMGRNISSLPPAAWSAI